MRDEKYLVDPDAVLIEHWDFRFVRYFLHMVLWATLLLLGGLGVMSWYLGMIVSVKGEGSIEPYNWYLVKAPQGGIVQEIYVQQGDRVELGKCLLKLDDTDLRAEFDQVQKEQELNLSRMSELAVNIRSEYEIRLAEFTRDQQILVQTRLQLEQIQIEQQLQQGGRFLQKSLGQLWPVRLGNAALAEKEAGLVVSAKRLAAVRGRGQELVTLQKVQEKLEQQKILVETRLAKMQIRALNSGTVISSNLAYRVGDYVQKGEVILKIANLHAWKASIGVHEADLPKINVGQTVRIFLDAYPHMEYQVFEGWVDKIPSGPAEHFRAGYSYYISVVLQNPTTTSREDLYNLTNGMNLDAKIEVEQGRIIELLWKYVLRSTGELSRHNMFWYQQDKEVEKDA